MKIKVYLLSIFLTFFTYANEKQTDLVEFTESSNKDWRIINDGVMGGLSTSQISVTDKVATFEGNLSLKNFGGFASTRMMLSENLPETAKHIVLKIKGDGRKYQFRVRADKRFDGIAFKYDFESKKDEWLTIKIPIDKLRSSWRGMHIPRYKAPKPNQIRQIGFLIGDKKEGKFKLHIKSIAYE